MDEILGINNGLVEVPAARGAPGGAEPQQQQRRGRRVPLNSSDVLFRELRDLNFGSVGPKLRNKTMHMREEYQDINTKGFSEVHQFVKKLNIMPVLDRHTELASLIQEKSAMDEKFLRRLRCEQDLLDGRGVDQACEYAEELMFLERAPLESVLRLVSLVSQVNGGVPKKHYDALKRGSSTCTGIAAWPVCSASRALAWPGGTRAAGTPSSGPEGLQARRGRGADDASPTDISYVYSGYAPLSCRLVDAALRPGGLEQDEAARLIPGPQFTFEQRAPGGRPGARGRGWRQEDRAGLLHRGGHLCGNLGLAVHGIPGRPRRELRGHGDQAY